MIQRTAIWILATFALCSPGAIPFDRAMAPLDAGFVTWSVRGESKAIEQTRSREFRQRSVDTFKPFHRTSERDSAFASRLYFGSLYNRPPPASLFFS